MNEEDRYLFATHPKAEVARWSAALRWFSFCRARGGRFDDGDSFEMSILFGDEAELRRVMAALGLPLRPSPRPDPAALARCTPEQLARFKRIMKVAETLPPPPPWESPGWVEVAAGVRAFVGVREDHVLVSVSGGAGGADIYAVAERDFEIALVIERHLAAHGLRYGHPPPGCQCVCRGCKPASWE